MLSWSAESKASDISFDEAIKASLQSSAVQAPEVELEARTKRDRSLPGNRGPINLSLNPGWRLNPTGEAGAEFTVGVTQSWNLAALGKKRKRAAHSERNVVAAEMRARALSARIGAAQRWLELYQAERLYELIEEELVVAANFDARQKRALEVGVITLVEQSVSAAAFAETKRLVLMLEGHRVEAAFALSLALGIAPDQSLKTKGGLPSPTLPSHGEVLRLASQVDNLPQVELRRLQSVADNARAAEELAGAGRTLSFGMQVQRESSGSTLLFGTLGVQFSGPNRSQRQRSVLDAQALRKLEEAKGLASALRVDLADAIHEVEHTAEEVKLVSDILLPTREELLTRRQRELEVGQGTLTEVLRARTSVFQARRLSTQAKLAHRWAKVHLWLLLAEIELSLGQGEQR